MLLLPPFVVSAQVPARQASSPPQAPQAPPLTAPQPMAPAPPSPQSASPGQPNPQGVPPLPLPPSPDAVAVPSAGEALPARPLPDSLEAVFGCERAEAGAPGYALPPGFDAGAGFACVSGALVPETPGTPGVLHRWLPAAPAGGQRLQFAAAARVQVVPGRNADAGFGLIGGAEDVSAPGSTQQSPTPQGPAPQSVGLQSPAPQLRVRIGANGLALETGGAPTPLLPVQGLAQGEPGSTDSGFGAGWMAAPRGSYDVALLRDGDGDTLVSMTLPDTVSHSAAFRLHGLALPPCMEAPCLADAAGRPAPPARFEVRVQAETDRVTFASYALQAAAPESAMLLPPHASATGGVGVLLRWNLSAGGGICAPGESACTDVFAWVPPTYQGTQPSKWVIVLHGFGENAQVVQGEYNSGAAPLADTLYRQGFVIVSLDNTNRNCYGNQQCVDDLTHLSALLHSELTLETEPYLMADSMGGFQMLNAIATGAVHPRAVAGFCVNTNLDWDYRSGGAQGVIDAAYGIPGQPYGQATEGWDPQRASGEALQRLVATPMLLIASDGDPVVMLDENSASFAAMLEAKGGHAEVLRKSSNAHVPPAVFDGEAVARFFHAHEASAAPVLQSTHP